MEVLDISPEERDMLETVLDQMVKEGSLVVTKKGKYAIPETLGFLVGRLQGHPKGFGFLIPIIRMKRIYLSAENMEGAMHNDRVMVRLLTRKSNGDKSREGEVVRILERANKTIVGSLEKEKHFGFVIPDDSRIAFDIFIPEEESRELDRTAK